MQSIRNVVVGISGGVDSSVAALLLKKKGFNVIGLFMKNWDERDETGKCGVTEDLEDAKYVCKRLDIPFHEVNFVKEYWNEVFLQFTSEYEKGFTPNPDILCNKHIKFKFFFNHALKYFNADAIATGHYARTSFGDYLENYEDGVNVRLLKPKDNVKDQTFFLSQVSQEPLRKTMFPLAHLVKGTVKKIAKENGLEKIANKPESMGICFIGDRKFKKFMPEYVTPKPGKFINVENGKVLGNHDGVHLFTIGQRSCLGGVNGALYVVKKNATNSDILVAPGLLHPILFSSMFYTEQPHWIADPLDLSDVEEVDFRFQHVKYLVKCKLFSMSSGGLFAVLNRPLRALTQGQYAVFYKQDECLGSAKIVEIGPSEYSLGNELPSDYKEYPSFLEDKCSINSE